MNQKLLSELKLLIDDCDVSANSTIESIRNLLYNPNTLSPEKNERDRVLGLLKKYKEVLNWMSRLWNRHSHYYRLSIVDNVVTFKKSRTDASESTLRSGMHNLLQVCRLSGIEPKSWGTDSAGEYKVEFDESDVLKWYDEGDAVVVYCEEDSLWQPESGIVQRHVLHVFCEENIYLVGSDWVTVLTDEHTLKGVDELNTLINLITLSNFEWESSFASHEIIKFLRRSDLLKRDLTI